MQQQDANLDTTGYPIAKRAIKKYGLSIKCGRVEQTAPEATWIETEAGGHESMPVPMEKITQVARVGDVVGLLIDKNERVTQAHGAISKKTLVIHSNTEGVEAAATVMAHPNDLIGCGMVLGMLFSLFPGWGILMSWTLAMHFVAMAIRSVNRKRNFKLFLFFALGYLIINGVFLDWATPPRGHSQEFSTFGITLGIALFAFNAYMFYKLSALMMDEGTNADTELREILIRETEATQARCQMQSKSEPLCARAREVKLSQGFTALLLAGSQPYVVFSVDNCRL